MRIERQSAYADVSFPFENEMRIDYIESKIKRQGHATDLMLYILTMAETFGCDVSLLPVCNSGMGREKLREWYAGFGFVDFERGMIKKFLPNISE